MLFFFSNKCAEVHEKSFIDFERGSDFWKNNNTRMERLKDKHTGRKGQIHAQIYLINYIYNIVNVWVILS